MERAGRWSRRSRSHLISEPSRTTFSNVISLPLCLKESAWDGKKREIGVGVGEPIGREAEVGQHLLRLTLSEFRADWTRRCARVHSFHTLCDSDFFRRNSHRTELRFHLAMMTGLSRWPLNERRVKWSTRRRHIWAEETLDRLWSSAELMPFLGRYYAYKILASQKHSNKTTKK